MAIEYKENYLNNAIEFAEFAMNRSKNTLLPNSDELANSSQVLRDVFEEYGFSYTSLLINIYDECQAVYSYSQKVVDYFNEIKSILNTNEVNTSEEIDDSLDEIFYETLYQPILEPTRKKIELSDGTVIEFDFYNQNDYQDYYYSEDPLNESSGIRTSYPSLGKYDEENGITALSIRSSGCGATSPANVLSYVLGEKHDPIELASVLASNGGLNGSGDTIHSAYPEILQENYGVKVTPVNSMSEVQEALKNPNTAVIASCGSYFTNGGHLVSIMATDPNTGQVYVADPNDRDNIEGGYDSMKGSHGSGWYDPNEIKGAFGSYYIVEKAE